MAQSKKRFRHGWTAALAMASAMIPAYISTIYCLRYASSFSTGAANEITRISYSCGANLVNCPISIVRQRGIGSIGSIDRGGEWFSTRTFSPAHPAYVGIIGGRGVRGRRLNTNNRKTAAYLTSQLDDTASKTSSPPSSASLLQKSLQRMSIAMNKSTSSQVFQNHPEYSASLSQLRKKVAQFTHIAPSSLNKGGKDAGLGLFASKNIKAGMVVGFYPSHALGMEHTQGGEEQSVFTTLNEQDGSYFEDHPHGTSPYLHATDQPIFQRPSLLSPLLDGESQSPILYLDVNPTRNEELDDIWTSHYINDGASLLDQLDCLDPSNGKPFAISEEDIENYYRQSTQNKNCIHIPFGPSPLLATVTTRKVKKGQELFTSYGVVYWLGALDEMKEKSNLKSEEAGEKDGNKEQVYAAMEVPEMTDRIQSHIMDSARDLQKAMEAARKQYAMEMNDLQCVMQEL